MAMFTAEGKHIAWFMSQFQILVHFHILFLSAFVILPLIFHSAVSKVIAFQEKVDIPSVAS